MEPIFKIYHETNSQNLKRIIESGHLKKKSDLNGDYEAVQGSKNRRITDDPKVSLTDSNFWEKFDDVNCIYTRIHPLKEDIPTIKGHVVIVFSKDILNHYNWILNTTENFGFYIAKEGVMGESQFSGEEGMTLTKKTLHLLDISTFDPTYSELAFFDSIQLTFAVDIFLKKGDASIVKLLKAKYPHINVFIK